MQRMGCCVREAVAGRDGKGRLFTRVVVKVDLVF